MTEFEKRCDGLTIEKEMQAHWDEHRIYDFVPDKSRPIYSIDTPPPTVSLHIGHIFFEKDFIACMQAKKVVHKLQ
jgi:valyl-tRNA synthetase